jgi:hypothetical protein
MCKADGKKMSKRLKNYPDPQECASGESPKQTNQWIGMDQRFFPYVCKEFHGEWKKLGIRDYLRLESIHGCAYLL